MNAVKVANKANKHARNARGDLREVRRYFAAGDALGKAAKREARKAARIFARAIIAEALAD